MFKIYFLGYLALASKKQEANSNKMKHQHWDLSFRNSISELLSALANHDILH